MVITLEVLDMCQRLAQGRSGSENNSVKFIILQRLKEKIKEISYLASFAVDNSNIVLITGQPAVNTLTERLDKF